MPAQRSIEVRVGFFVVVCLVIGASLVWKFGKFSRTTAKQYTLIVAFDNVSGLIPDANVMYAGVSVGKVREIRLDETGKYRAIVTLGINEGIKIRRDAKFVINQSGLLGDRYVDIIPGTSTAEPLKPGETVAGSASVDLTEALRSVVEVLQQAGGTIQRVNQMLQRVDAAIQRVDEMALSTQNLQHVSATLAHVSNTASNAANLTAELRSLIQESRGTITNTLCTLAAAGTHVRNTTRQVDDLVRDTHTDIKQVTKNLTETAEKLNLILSRLEKGEGTAGKLLTDTALYNELLQVLRNIQRYGLFYKTWLGPKTRTPELETQDRPPHPSTLEPPRGGRTPVPARPAHKTTEGKQ